MRKMDTLGIIMKLGLMGDDSQYKDLKKEILNTNGEKLSKAAKEQLEKLMGTSSRMYRK